MAEDQTLCVTTREEWRAWLEEHCATSQRIWLIYYKKHTGKPTIPYDDAVEEAICFGWIDGLVRRIDDERYMQRYTPRKPRSIWADSNKARVEKMAREGLMTPAGMALVTAAKADGSWDDYDDRKLLADPPRELIVALAEAPEAEEFFNSLAPSHRKQYVWWIRSAKRADTKARRVAKIVERCAEGKKPGMM